MAMSMDQTARDKKPGVPKYASPWIEVGRLTEKEKWQAFTVHLMQSTIDAELEDLKRAVGDAFSQRSFGAPSLSFSLSRRGRSFNLPPSLGANPELKQQVVGIIDSSKLNISSLISEYLQFFNPKAANFDSSAEQQSTGKDEPKTTPSTV